MNGADVFVVLAMAAILVMYVRNQYGEVEYVKAQDGRTYLVRKLPDSKKAADFLAAINKDLLFVVQHVKAKFGESRPEANRLFANYDPESLSEGGIEAGYTSFTVNKGERIVLCLRQADKTFVDKNVLLYVAIHELAHLATDETGHTPKFWENFRWILREAIDIGIYKKIDFEKDPRQYCGMTITSSVL
jgi:hypothetical protein